MNDPVDVLLERIRAAAAAGTALRIRGGGTKDFLAERLDGALLDTRPLTGVVSYEPSELVVTVRGGTPLATLESLLARNGQCLPFEPPHFGGGTTVGGMVAAGLSGPSRASVGAVRDYVLGTVVANGRGELLTFGGQVMKNVAGYDVSRLMAGAFGTLGVIVEASLKVLPVAPAEATLVFELPQSQALERLHAWGGRPLPLDASRWSAHGGVELLHVRLRGAAAAVEAACRSMGGERQGATLAAAEWGQLREQRLPWFLEGPPQELWRLSVPQVTPVLDLPQPTLVEWHGGQRWVRVEPGAGDRLRAIATAAGGHATLFRGIRGQPATGRFTPPAPPLDRIGRELKRQFDPAGIFNPGRLYPDA